MMLLGETHLQIFLMYGLRKLTCTQQTKIASKCLLEIKLIRYCFSALTTVLSVRTVFLSYFSLNALVFDDPFQRKWKIGILVMDVDHMVWVLCSISFFSPYFHLVVDSQNCLLQACICPKILGVGKVGIFSYP